jgi:hypothetical protein
MRALGALVLSLGLFACGGGSKPAAQEPAGEEETAEEEAPTDPELCCCDYIEETGDGDEMAENQTFSMMPPDECAGIGQCSEDPEACMAD